MATKKTTGKASKASAMPYEMRDFDALEYDIGHLAERAVLKHPQVQKRIEKMKAKAAAKRPTATRASRRSGRRNPRQRRTAQESVLKRSSRGRGR